MNNDQYGLFDGRISTECHCLIKSRLGYFIQHYVLSLYYSKI